VLLVSFGAPERPEDIRPFLEKVTRGRGVPPARLEAVERQYLSLGGKSPLGEQVRALGMALSEAMHALGLDVPVYLGNRNWHPLLEDTLRQMAEDKVSRALALTTSPWSSYSSCRQYLENIEEAQRAVGEACPEVYKLPPYWNLEAFVAAWTRRVAEAISQVPHEERDRLALLFSAHSIPEWMAAASDYALQLNDVAAAVSSRLGGIAWMVAYQSRSGSGAEPWLGPDVMEAYFELARKGRIVVVVPLGFLSEHMEVLYDLDVALADQAARLGSRFLRTRCVGDQPGFVAGLAELVAFAFGDGPEPPRAMELEMRGPYCGPGCCLVASEAG